MSMLSAQVDELRAMAESVGLVMPQAATLMMDAADTIWQLRDDLQRANAAVRDAEHDESMAWDRVRKAEAEKAKLLELVADMWNDMSVCYEQYVRISSSDMRFYGDRMRELGIEVEP